MAEFASRASDVKCWIVVWRCINTFCIGKLSKSIDSLAAIANDKSKCFEFLFSAVKTGCFCIEYGLEKLSEVQMKDRKIKKKKKTNKNYIKISLSRNSVTRYTANR